MSTRRIRFNTVRTDIVIAVIMTALITVQGHVAPEQYARSYRNAVAVMESELALIGGCFFTILALSFGVRCLIMRISPRVRPVQDADMIRWLSGWRLVVTGKLATFVVFGLVSFFSQFISPLSDEQRAAIFGQPFVDWQIANPTLWFMAFWCFVWGSMIALGHKGRTYVWPETKRVPRRTLTDQAH
jgi:hypothetical protein